MMHYKLTPVQRIRFTEYINGISVEKKNKTKKWA